MASAKKTTLFLYLTITLFSLLFIIRSLIIMIQVPLYDFDEAHRAENAKRMKEYQSFFVPLTGSPYDRVGNLKIPLKENPNLYLFYHLERPPLIYDLMIASTTIFGNYEWAYRLPSFLFGIGTISAFFVFVKKGKEKNIFAAVAALTALITSKDIWLSAQYAQMDTGITFFLFLSLMTLIIFCERRKSLLIYLSGIFFGLALLSKLQPASIFIFPVSFLFFTKKLRIWDLSKFVAGSALVFLPWVLYLILKFGFKDVINIMPGFALTSASIIDINHKAPFFWYIRWFWESLRPGWTLFLALLFYDVFRGSLSWKKLTLLSYIICGLLAFSIPVSKLWWYILPVVPAVCYYIFLSVHDYLKEKSEKLINLFLVIIIASLPVFLQSTNKITLLYGFVVTFLCFFILNSKKLQTFKKFFNPEIFLLGAVVVSLFAFFVYFPQIIPYHWNTKYVANYYKDLPDQKCLWIGDMPTEAVLFYSNAGEVLPIQTITHTGLFLKCPSNYLITPDGYDDHDHKGELIIREGNIRLYKLNR